jgi:transmembrane sensor
MDQQIVEIANRFITEKECSASELTELKKWLTDSCFQQEVEIWLSENWIHAEEIESGVLIETIFEQIEEQEKQFRRKPNRSIIRILNIYQRVAAFLLIPLIVAGILYLTVYQSQPITNFTETYSPRGQKSQITLVDGTKVWLNSDTKIKYPGAFSDKQRDVYLEGEAFFEVEKDPHHPFVVHTSKLDVKVLGTKFDVKAYGDENQIETSLFEGKVNLVIPQTINGGKGEKELSPGQTLVFSKTDNKVRKGKFLKEEIDGWKTNRLIFKDDTFNNLVRKMERWYNVKVVYDEKLFNDRKLTVDLYEDERLDRLMEIIGIALSVDYKYEKGQIILTPKSKKNM